MATTRIKREPRNKKVAKSGRVKNYLDYIGEAKKKETDPAYFRKFYPREEFRKRI